MAIDLTSPFPPTLQQLAQEPQKDPRTAEERLAKIYEAYFANKQGTHLAAALYDKVEKFQAVFPSTPQFRDYLRGFTYFFGVPTTENPWNSSDVAQAGVDGELTATRDGTLANIGNHIVNMATSSKIAFKTSPVNSNFSNQASNQFVAPILDYYMEHMGVEECLRMNATDTVPFGEAYLLMEWNQSLGKPWKVDQLTGRQINEGDLEFTVCAPWKVVKDLYKEDGDAEWYIICRQVNRVSIAAKYYGNDNADTIVTMRDQSTMLNKTYFKLFLEQDCDNTDYITMFSFYHDRTPACPQGKYAHFLSNNILLESGPLPYDELPVYRMTPQNITGTSAGRSPFHHVMGIQPLLDDGISSVLTSMEMASVPNVVAPDGCTVDKSMIEGGNFIKVPNSNMSGGQMVLPQMLKFDYLNPDTMQVIKMLQSLAETNSGVNSLVRGEPQDSLKSGSALALVQSTAIQYAAPYIQAYTKHCERVANGMIRMLAKFAESPRLITISGNDTAPYQINFNSTTFKDVDRVQVEEVNPLSKTVAGRQQMADDLWQKGLIKTLPEYLAVYDTGRVKPILKASVNTLISIQKENERLRKGDTPPVFPLQDHATHIQEHAGDFALIEATLDLNDPAHVAIVQGYMAHLDTHVTTLQNMNPDLLMMLGWRGLPDGVGPSGPGAQPMAPPGGGQQRQPGQPPMVGGRPGLTRGAPSPTIGSPAARINNPATAQPQPPKEPTQPKIAGTNVQAQPGTPQLPNGAPVT